MQTRVGKGTGGRVGRLVKGVEAEGWRFVAFTRLEALGEDPERPIAIVCRTDRRSAKAATLLARLGFADVQVVRGGMTAWLERGWPVERNISKPPGSGQIASQSRMSGLRMSYSILKESMCRLTVEYDDGLE